MLQQIGFALFFGALCAAGADVDVVNIPLTPQRDPLKKRVYQFL